jgi:hypothetical protein
MVEEGTLGLVRAKESPARSNQSDDDSSKDELQHRMEVARESITNTVDEIKDAVVNQYESVKESVSQTLDWHEQVKKRPVAWSAGALGAGFIVGYGVAAIVKGPNKVSVSRDEDRPIGGAAPLSQAEIDHGRVPEQRASGPGLIQRIKETPAYDRVKSEAGVIGNNFVDGISKKAQEIVLPAAIAWIGSWLEGLVPAKKGLVPPKTDPQTKSH